MISKIYVGIRSKFTIAFEVEAKQTDFSLDPESIKNIFLFQLFNRFNGKILRRSMN